MNLGNSPKQDQTATATALRGERIVALDCAALLGPAGPVPMTGVVHLRLADLTADLLAEAAPVTIFLPLIAPQGDAATAVERLEELGYGGRLIVLAPALPRPRLVERELRCLGPGARLTVISPEV